MNEFQLPIKITWETLNKRLGPLYQYISPITVNNSTILLNPTGSKTMCVIEGIIDGATVTDVYFKVNPITEQAIGNQLFLISKPNSTGGDITFQYDASQFFVTNCAGSNTKTVFNNAGQERSVTIFTFDGEVWVSTNNKC
jgi:hypothetical protein